MSMLVKGFEELASPAAALRPVCQREQRLAGRVWAGKSRRVERFLCEMSIHRYVLFNPRDSGLKILSLISTFFR